MSSKGIVLAEECHVVLAGAPIDINGAGMSSDVFSMKNYGHATIILGLGVTGAATTVTVAECDDFTPTNSTDIAFASYAEVTAGGDTLGARTATAATGIACSTNDGVFYVFEIDAAELTDGFPNLQVTLTDPSAATLATIIVVLSGARMADGKIPVTAIA